MVRRRIAAGVAVVLLIIIVLVINGCLKSQKTQSLKDYNRHVGQIASESDSQVSKPLFTALSGAGSKSALDVEVQIDQLRISRTDGRVATRRKLSRAGRNGRRAARPAAGAELPRRRDDEGRRAACPRRSAARTSRRARLIAGDMEIFLASDVIFSQRVVPLIEQTLTSNGIKGLPQPSSRFLPNIGWLEPNTVFARITGQAPPRSPRRRSPATTAAQLKGVSVGTNTLAPEPTLNHITGGSNPTFTVQVENSGEFPETNVKVDITVTAGGKQYKASHVIEKTEPGKTVNVEIPVTGIPLGVAAKVQVNIEGVPGENDRENNKGTFLAIFGA